MTKPEPGSSKVGNRGLVTDARAAGFRMRRASSIYAAANSLQVAVEQHWKNRRLDERAELSQVTPPQDHRGDGKS